MWDSNQREHGAAPRVIAGIATPPPSVLVGNIDLLL
jgi:hypothetical protein